MRTRCLAISFAALALGASVARPAGAQVSYYGGRVISNVEIVEVSWTSGVDPNYMQQLAGFYQTIVNSPFIDWMTEYDTIGKSSVSDGMPGSGQHIGRGTYGGAVTIQPMNTNTQLDYTEIGVEVANQLASGGLPPPKLDAAGNVDTLYMIDFPPGYSITLEGTQSCVYFGAYHFTVSYQGKSIPYGVHPNCGYSFDDSTFIHSHELAEAITDTEVGLVDLDAPNERPIGWIGSPAQNSQEVGDLCEQASMGNIGGYTVTSVWSNYANGCVFQIPICDGSSAPPSCRTCSAYDNGAACSGATPACATGGSNAGKCVACTSSFAMGCTGSTPVCDDSTNSCVGCMASSDCSASAPVCDTTSKTCRACQGDGECATGHCDTGSGACVACKVDADCGAEMSCVNEACVASDPATTGTSAASGGLETTSSGGETTGAGGAGTFLDDGSNEDPKNGVVGSCACRAGAPSDDDRAAIFVVACGVALVASRRRRTR